MIALTCSGADEAFIRRWQVGSKGRNGSAGVLRLRTFGDCCQRRPPGCREHSTEKRGRDCTEHLSQPVVFRPRWRVPQNAQETLTHSKIQSDEQRRLHGRRAI
jgi:hypothetical protein